METQRLLPMEVGVEASVVVKGNHQYQEPVLLLYQVSQAEPKIHEICDVECHEQMALVFHQAVQVLVGVTLGV